MKIRFLIYANILLLLFKSYNISFAEGSGVEATPHNNPYQIANQQKEDFLKAYDESTSRPDKDANLIKALRAHEQGQTAASRLEIDNYKERAADKTNNGFLERKKNALKARVTSLNTKLNQGIGKITRSAISGTTLKNAEEEAQANARRNKEIVKDPSHSFFKRTTARMKGRFYSGSASALRNFHRATRAAGVGYARRSLGIRR